MSVGFFGYFFGDGADTAHNGFDHQKIYDEWQTGPGVASMSQAAGAWSTKVGDAFKGAHDELEKVLKDSEVAVKGAGGDAMRQSVAPLQRATRESVDVSGQIGSTVEQQAQASSTFKHSFPAPAPVPPSNIQWYDYFSPTSYAIKKGSHMAAEQHHDEVEAEARRQYTEYTNDSYGRTGNIQQFSPVPKFSGDVSKADARDVGGVNADTGYTGHRVGTGYTYSGSGDTGSGIGTGRGTGTPSTAGSSYSPAGSGDSGTSSPGSPAGSESAWVTPPPATASPLPGTGTVTPGGTNNYTNIVGGPVGGPSSRSGTGNGTGRGGTDSGRGVSGRTGSGTGTGRGGTGTGGRTGTGTGTGGTPRSGSGNGGMPRGRAAMPSVSSTSSSSSSAMRGAPMGGANRGQQGDGDEEHENKYVLETDVIGEDLDLPRTAPAVIGEDLEPQKPPHS